MSMATRTDTQSLAPHIADSHDLIRVHGARVNNLKDVSVEIPKRRLTVFTGVSGSGKSSLVFGTIAAESQRLINETYSAFVQGFMPTLARPEVDVLEGLDDRDHRRPAADGCRRPLHGRHRHRRQRDAAHPLQPTRAAAHRLAQRVLLQRRLGPGDRCDHDRTRCQQDRCDRPSPAPAACVRAAKAGARSPISTFLSCTTTASRSTRARSPSPATAWTAGTAGIFSESRLPRPGQADPQIHQEGAPRPALQGADQDEGQRRQPHLRGADPADPEVVPLQGPGVAAAAHPGVRGPGGHLHDLSRLRRHPAQRGGPVVADRRASTSPTPARCRSATSPSGSRGLDEPSVAPLLAALQRTLDSFVEIGLGYLSRSTGRRARCRAARRSASR